MKRLAYILILLALATSAGCQWATYKEKWATTPQSVTTATGEGKDSAKASTAAWKLITWTHPDGTVYTVTCDGTVVRWVAKTEGEDK